MEYILNSKIVYTFIGFVIGITTTLGIIYYLVTSTFNRTDSDTKINQEYSLNSKAMQDKTECPKASASMLVGVWKGKSDKQTWTVKRNPEGTYRIDFKFLPKGSKKDMQEEGYWSYSNCLYGVIVKSVNGEPVLYQEVYRVHEINERKMSYTNYRSGSSYTIFKETN